MTRLLPALLAWFLAFFRYRHDLGLELAAFASSARRSQTQEPPTQIEPLGSPVLANSPALAVQMILILWSEPQF
jgi:hypothetical protein